MNLKNNVSLKIVDLLATADGAPLMTLMADGRLHINTDEPCMADNFMAYTNNSVFMSMNGSSCYIGVLPTDPVVLDVFHSKLVMNEVETSGCLVRSAEPVLDENYHFLAYFRYENCVVLVVADSDISHGAMLSAMEYTPEGDAFMRHIFLSLVARHDAEMSAEAAKRQADLLNQIKKVV